ncbi:tRNA uridine(34) hydroxylase [Buchnera aphidicola (Phyllaphis fagi)]|uniref:oxygen-dependent tRNA uridine(34) hydroxylase TrhO n=1 Tax=Buchnera aphidicola TaxID=9 RepID=UPI003464E3D0
MSLLHNIYSKKILKYDMLINHESRINLSFYKYCNIINLIEFKYKLYKLLNKLNVFGRIYISTEGINAQISVLKKKYYIFKKYLYHAHQLFKNIRINKSIDDKQSFWMLKIKIRCKIVADGLLNTNYDDKNVGIYVKPDQVNSMLNDPNIIFVDMRNSYEYNIGKFKNAICIPGKTFRIQLNNILEILKNYKNNKIVLYCTGGIRCEKATAWIKYHNFKKVYHVEGGIINYIDKARRKLLPIQFQGKLFVFDYRMMEKISNKILSLCKICKNICDNYINCSYDLCHCLFIQCKYCYIKYGGYCSENCMLKI